MKIRVEPDEPRIHRPQLLRVRMTSCGNQIYCNLCQNLKIFEVKQWILKAILLNGGKEVPRRDKERCYLNVFPLHITRNRCSEIVFKCAKSSVSGTKKDRTSSGNP